MTDVPSSTPPAAQEQPAAFDASWEQADASFLRPTAIPRPKVPRGWERQPQSPFARNGRYRKVWKRYELRSQPKTASQKSPPKSPGKVVKKRALDAVMPDPNATPGRTRPKNKAFAPTRWETPRRHSGRLARKLAQPPTMEDRKQDLLSSTEDQATAAEAESAPEEDIKDSMPLKKLSVPARKTQSEDASMAEEKDEMAVDVAFGRQTAEETSIIQFLEDDTTPAESEAIPTEALADFDLTAENESSLTSAEANGQISNSTNDSESNPTVVELVESSLSPQEEHSAELAQVPEVTLVSKASAPVVDTPEAPVIVATQSWTEDGDLAASTTDADTIMKNQEEQRASDIRELEDSAYNITFAVDKVEQSVVVEENKENDTLALTTSISTTERDFSSSSDEEMEEAESFHDEALALTDRPEGFADAGTDLPSPSLSVATSPRFSAIADTLTLNLPDRTPPKKREASREQDEPGSPMNSDTAFLKEFLSRADASKANRVADVARRQSVTNRRDSGIIRQALASPRVVLEDKDPNSPNHATNIGSAVREEMPKDTEGSSPAKSLFGGKKLDFGEDITADFALGAPAAEVAEAAETTPNPQNTRRSSRARNSRLPATPSSASSAATPNRIPVRRADGTEPVVLKKSEAQALAMMTRTNTRRNKGSALTAPIRLNKLRAEASGGGSADVFSPSGTVPTLPNAETEIFSASMIRWDEQLVYFQEQRNTTLTSLSEDELAGPPAGESEKGNSVTPSRTKRANGSGASNGTPAKGLLAPASMLPADAQAESQAEKGGPKKSSKSGGRSKRGVKKTKNDNSGHAESSEVRPPAAPAAPTSSPPIVAPGKEVQPQPQVQQSQPAPASAPAPQQQPSHSQLPTPATSASRRSRLQTPRKVKLPVPVSSSTGKNSTVGMGQQQREKENRIIGSTPKKMPIGKPASLMTASASETGGEGPGQGQTGTGIPFGAAGRRRVGRRA